MFLGFHRVRGTYGFSFIANKKRYTPFVQFSLVNKWWIPHFETWEKDTSTTYICGWVFFYFGYMEGK